MSTKLKILTASVLMAIGMSASASPGSSTVVFDTELKCTTEVVPADSSRDIRIEIGLGVAEIINTSAKSFPFELAVNAILPSGWTADVSQLPEGENVLVGWESGLEWTRIMEVFGYIHPSVPNVVINWQDKSVAFQVPPPVEKTSCIEVPIEVAAQPEVVRESRVSHPSSNGQWIVARGDTLRNVIERWAAMDGWTVHWDLIERQQVRDFILGADAQFAGSIDMVVDQLIRSVADARRWVEADFWVDNKVIHIRPASGSEVIR